jgi:LacI family transcriptional regulator
MSLNESKPRKICTFLPSYRITREYEVLTGLYRYVRTTDTLTLGSHPGLAIHVEMDSLLKWSGDGVIGFFFRPERVTELLARGIQVVNLTESLAPLDLPVPVVVSDNEMIGRLVAAHLLERGFRRFAFIGVDELFSRRRLKGFEDALREKGISESSIIKPTLEKYRGLSAQSLAAQCEGIERPFAVFAADDDLAARTLSAALEIGIRVPKEMGIIGVNDLELICDAAAVPLTSVAHAHSKIGFEAGRLIDQLLQGQPVDRKIFRIPPLGVVPRVSTRTFAFDDPLVEEAMIFIYANIGRPFKVGDVVKHCGKSRKSLEVKFANAVGSTMHDEIIRLRIDRAKQLLAGTYWTVGRIAEECGFGDSRTLKQAFVRIEGSTPESYRNE